MAEREGKSTAGSLLTDRSRKNSRLFTRYELTMNRHPERRKEPEIAILSYGFNE
jgi:hypothetical protein